MVYLLLVHTLKSDGCIPIRDLLLGINDLDLIMHTLYCQNSFFFFVLDFCTCSYVNVNLERIMKLFVQ